jgi:hypothetical protein
VTLTRAEREMAALRNAALDELMQLSDSELLDDATAEGLEVSQIARSVRVCMTSASAAFMRQRLLSAKANVERGRSLDPLPKLSISELKELVQRAFQSDPLLGMAFRGGTSQTDEDWVSLYEDLVELGAIKPDEQV